MTTETPAARFSRKRMTTPAELRDAAMGVVAGALAAVRADPTTNSLNRKRRERNAMRDAVADVFRGETAPDWHLNPADIVDAYADGEVTQSDLAAQFAVSTATVSNALAGKINYFIRRSDAPLVVPGSRRRGPTRTELAVAAGTAIDPEAIRKWEMMFDMNHGRRATLTEVAEAFDISERLASEVLRFKRDQPITPRPARRKGAQRSTQNRKREEAAAIAAKRRRAAGLPTGGCLTPDEREQFDEWVRETPAGMRRPEWVEAGVPLVPRLPYHASLRPLVDLREGDTMRLRGEGAHFRAGRSAPQAGTRNHPLVIAARRWAEGLFAIEAESDGLGGSLHLTRKPLPRGYTPSAPHGGAVRFPATCPELTEALDSFLPGDSALFEADDLHGNPDHHPAAVTAKTLQARDKRDGNPPRTFLWRRMEGGLRVYRVE